MDKVHEGHRERLRSRALETDMAALKPHEVLEYLLFFAIPRQNINPLAHALMQRFGTLQGVFTASPEALREVSGVSEKAAEWLHTAGNAVMEYIRADRERVSLRTRMDARNFLKELLARHLDASRWLICLSETGGILRLLPMRETGEWYTAENLRPVIEASLSSRCNHILLVQRRDIPVFTEEERHRNDGLTRALSRLGITLLEHMLISPDGTVAGYASKAEKAPKELAERSELADGWDI